MTRAVVRQGLVAGVLELLCAACAPTASTRAGTTLSQGERNYEACRLEGMARLTERLPRLEDYGVQVSAFESGPYELENRLRFAAQGTVAREYEEYFSEQLRAYIPDCMARKGYEQGRYTPPTAPAR